MMDKQPHDTADEEQDLVNRAYSLSRAVRITVTSGVVGVVVAALFGSYLAICAVIVGARHDATASDYLPLAIFFSLVLVVFVSGGFWGFVDAALDPIARRAAKEVVGVRGYRPGDSVTRKQQVLRDRRMFTLLKRLAVAYFTKWEREAVEKARAEAHGREIVGVVEGATAAKSDA